MILRVYDSLLIYAMLRGCGVKPGRAALGAGAWLLDLEPHPVRVTDFRTVTLESFERHPGSNYPSTPNMGLTQGGLEKLIRRLVKFGLLDVWEGDWYRTSARGLEVLRHRLDARQVTKRRRLA